MARRMIYMLSLTNFNIFNTSIEDEQRVRDRANWAVVAKEIKWGNNVKRGWYATGRAICHSIKFLGGGQASCPARRHVVFYIKKVTILLF